jgi:hypothetical protein
MNNVFALLSFPCAALLSLRLSGIPALAPLVLCAFLFGFSALSAEPLVFAAVCAVGLFFSAGAAWFGYMPPAAWLRRWLSMACGSAAPLSCCRSGAAVSQFVSASAFNQTAGISPAA